MRLVGYLGQDQQIIPAKGVGGLPLGFIFINAGKSDVVSEEVVTNRVLPDRRFDQAQAQLMNWYLSRCIRHRMARRGWRKKRLSTVPPGAVSVSE